MGHLDYEIFHDCRFSDLFCCACVRPDPKAAMRTQTIIIERLASEYGKVRQSQGLTAQGTVVAVFASRETGTWTVTGTFPTGLICSVRWYRF